MKEFFWTVAGGWMSAIGGLIDFDGNPITANRVQQLARGLALRGPDGGREIVNKSTAFIHRAFHTNRESHLERQPLELPTGHIICWDGRLDNRGELIELLGYRLDGDLTDPSIALSAYLNWGGGFLDHLIGDFALSIWDAYERTLLLARDPFGIRRLYYCIDHSTVIWSSELIGILSTTGRAPEIDDDYVAGFLSGSSDIGRTPYRGVCAVKPGHICSISKAHVSETRYWGLDPDKTITYRRDSEYEEEFRYHFRQSIKARLRGARPYSLY